ncbi:thiol reductant ABC exporter subunit CydD [Halothiobacillus diazotrophicus]|uniref:Thiol reductant ABC exporter subunit CydD n=1 Tax=Halothiobacillus diazotrophicus TaxID=1860122 RepID=A0A191ZJL1_9GAMM|nr:thiol reductant ABC exporter subunit CydD [Halothiobacillus diazotrophicus]ANJ68023.1 thiol reductant ABC exporter subunit CydD [Halothiobacillus diazotrophicus]
MRPAPAPSKAQTRRLDRWLRSEARNVRQPLRAAVALDGLNGFLLIAQCWLLALTLNATALEHALDHAQAHSLEKHSLEDVWGYIAAIACLFVLRAILNYLAQRLAFEAGARLRTGLRARLFARIEELGPAWSRNQRSGDIATRLVDGVEALDGYIAGYLPQVRRALLIPAAILVFVFPADWVSGLILAITAPLIPLFMILIGGETERLNQRQWRSLARMGAHFFDLIEGLTTLKLFNAARREARLVGRIAEDYRQETMGVLRVAFLSSMVLEFLAAISIAMVAVYVGFRLMYGEIHFQNGIFVLLLAPEFYLPLRSLGNQFHARMDALGAVEPIIELLNAPSPTDRQTDHRGTVPCHAQDANPNAGLREGSDEDRNEENPDDHPEADPDKAPGDIVFDGVDFAYPGGQPLFHHLDLTLPAGCVTALVGPSGAGKSTLTQLLMGFLPPTAGRIRIGGKDLAHIDPEAWRRHIAWVPQSPTLFLGTLAENIALDRDAAAAPIDDRTRSALWQAAERAQALAFIERLPKGFDTRVGERGQGLSGGEIQRIALARAFYKDAPIVVLDEPTASLDPESERLVSAAIARLAEKRTVLVIAHRLSTLASCDRILYLNDGRILEQGSHADLIAHDGAYADLYHRYRQATS